MKKLITTIILLSVSVAANAEAKAPASAKPNIVFLYADDFAYWAISALGNEIIQTPNLDRLIAQGVNFSNAFNMGGWNGAVCIASRSMLISGRSIWKANEINRQWGEGNTAAHSQTWGRLMSNAGYNTFATGKWHIQANPEQVFEETININPGGMPPDHLTGTPGLYDRVKEAYANGEDFYALLPPGYNRPLSETDDSWNASDPAHNGYWTDGTHWSEVQRTDAVNFIDSASESENPFFLYLAFNAPHDSRQSPKEFLDLYPLEDIPLPENWLPEYPYLDEMGDLRVMRDEMLGPVPRTPFAIRTHIREYYAIISHLDAQIGLILQALEERELMDNTYIFFTGDNGLSVGQHGLLGKQNMFDHSIHVPLLAAGPGLPSGTEVSSDVYLQDIMATSLSLAGIEKPDFVDFNSFLNLANGVASESPLPDGVYGAYMDTQRMIRKNGFKLILYPRNREVILFDLTADPLEMNDLSDNPQYVGKIRELFEGLLRLQAQMEDPLDLRDSFSFLIN
jgi:arylsulfatase A-like enzyme